MIVNAAILKDGVIYRARRHHLIIWEHEPQFFNNCEQGFVTDTGEFVDREEGAKIAFECGQIKEPKRILFSEDLW